MADIEVIVVGAGVVGLAIAQRLASEGREVMVLEREASIGEHASSRNSEVIHAGIYYPPGSLKARLCLDGRDRLYAWCEAHQVPHKRIGKLLVATTHDELPALEQLRLNAQTCGVPLQSLDADQVHDLEPAVTAVGGLFSALTGIVDSHALMQSFEAALLGQGGQLCLRTRVDRAERQEGGWLVEGQSSGQPFAVSCRWLINAGGLFAQQLAHSIDCYPAALIPSLHYCQGRYFSYSGSSPFRHLVYPMPEPNAVGLGVHATLDLGGQLRFGPDVRYTDSIDYQVDARLGEGFARSIQRYWPECRVERLQPGYAGVRAKLSGPGAAAADFMIQGPAAHGLQGIVSLFGIESPGLTASLALAEEVAGQLDNL